MRMRRKAAACSTLVRGLARRHERWSRPPPRPRMDPARPRRLTGRPSPSTSPTTEPRTRSSMMACSALGLLTIPAVGLFYGGMVRRKNVLSAFQQCFILLGIVPVQWVFVGYSLSFGPDALAGLLRRLAVVRAARGWTRASRRLSASCAAPAFHDLSDDGRRLAAGLDFGRDRRADEVCVVPGFHVALDDARLRPGGTLGVGPRRLDQAVRRTRLRRRADRFT